MSIKKTFLKSLSYGVMHMTIAIAVAYLLSGSWRVALAIGMVEPCVQVVAFFFHERAWHRIENRKKKKDYHDSVIDSTSPAPTLVENYLRHKH
ncbi:MAG: DUF2061 domain-containing protein [Bdellovibrionales bacterium]